jgi:hypothetical protein
MGSKDQQKPSAQLVLQLLTPLATLRDLLLGADATQLLLAEPKALPQSLHSQGSAT